MRTSTIAKNDIFVPFECTKIWLHIKSEWRLNDQTSRKSSLNFSFQKFLEHSVQGASRIICSNWTFIVSFKLRLFHLLMNVFKYFSAYLMQNRKSVGPTWVVMGRTPFYRTSNKLKRVHLLVIELKHPISASNERTSNI